MQRVYVQTAVNKPIPSFLVVDLLTPAVVRLAKNSTADDSCHLMALLREPFIMKTIKLYLDYLHAQPNNACYDDFTNISV